MSYMYSSTHQSMRNEAIFDLIQIGSVMYIYKKIISHMKDNLDRLSICTNKGYLEIKDKGTIFRLNYSIGDFDKSFVSLDVRNGGGEFSFIKIDIPYCQKRFYEEGYKEVIKSVAELVRNHREYSIWKAYYLVHNIGK